MPIKRVSGMTLCALVALIPWAVLFAYIVANSTTAGESTDWGNVATASIFGLIPLVLAVAFAVWQPGVRRLWHGWNGVLMSWAAAFCGLLAAAWTLGPFM